MVLLGGEEAKAQRGKQQRRRAIGRSGLADEKYKNSLGCPALGPALWGSEMTSRVSGTELAFIDEFRLLVQLQSLPGIESGRRLPGGKLSVASLGKR